MCNQWFNFHQTFISNRVVYLKRISFNWLTSIQVNKLENNSQSFYYFNFKYFIVNKPLYFSYVHG